MVLTPPGIRRGRANAKTQEHPMIAGICPASDSIDKKIVRRGDGR
jgi:hypothetical protein